MLHHQRTFMKFMAVVALLCSSTQALAEKPSDVLEHSAGVSQLQTTLSEAQYDTVEHQVPYEVQVPYQVLETYTDYETVYEQEYQCHTEYSNECSYETQCHQVSVPHCSTQQVCTNNPGHTECHTVQECGINALGEEICKDHQVCNQVGGGQSCHNEQSCYNTYENECDQEYVCHSVPHQECGYETVAHQVAVQKEHYVTYYKTEMQCCKTEYEQVYTGDKSVDVVIKFPVDAVLSPGEKEKIRVSIESISKPSVKIDDSDAILGYKIASQKVVGGKLVVELKVVPKYGANDLGKNTIESLYLNVDAQGRAELSFRDSGIRPHVTTSYAVNVKLKATGQLVGQASAANAGDKLVKIPVIAAAALGSDDLVAELTVNRQGSQVLSAPISFMVKADWDFAFESPAQFSDANLVAATAIRGAQSQAKLVLVDGSADHPMVHTDYEITIQRKGGFLGGSAKELVKGVVKREQLKANAAGEYEVDIVNDLKLAAADADKHLASGKSVTVLVMVTRQSPKLNNGQPIVINKEKAKLKVK